MIRKRKKEELSDSDTASSKDEAQDGKDIRVKEEDTAQCNITDGNVERGAKRKNKKTK